MGECVIVVVFNLIWLIMAGSPKEYFICFYGFPSVPKIPRWLTSLPFYIYLAWGIYELIVWLK